MTFSKVGERTMENLFRLVHERMLKVFLIRSLKKLLVV